MSANRISDQDDNDFEFSSSGASDSTPLQCSLLRRNGFVILKKRPCKLVEINVAKVGKHGHSKVHLIGIDLFNSNKYEEIWPSSHIIQIPIVIKKEYLLADISDDGFTTLFDDVKKETREDLKMSDEKFDVADLEEKLNRNMKVIVTVLKSMANEEIIAVRVDKKD